jgi:hypothetical protein
VLLVVAAEQQAVLRRRRDRAYRGQRREDERHEVRDPLERADPFEADVEGNDQQEREQDLHAGDDEAQLARELSQVAIEALELRLVATVLARDCPVRRGGPQALMLCRRDGGAPCDTPVRAAICCIARHAWQLPASARTGNSAYCS